MGEKSSGKVKCFFKGISNILKFSGWLLGIQIILSLFSVVLLSGDSDLIKVLSVVMFISSAAIIFFVAKSTAYSDFEIFKNNIIRTKRNDDVPKYRLMMEYRIYKGFLAGFIAALPSIILALIGIMQNPIVSESNICGKIAMVINFIFTIPLLNFGAANSLYLVFFGSAVTILSAGIGYLLQGEKLRIQYEELQSKRQ